jgi:hypothetical protein
VLTLAPVIAIPWRATITGQETKASRRQGRFLSPFYGREGGQGEPQWPKRRRFWESRVGEPSQGSTLSGRQPSKTEPLDDSFSPSKRRRTDASGAQWEDVTQSDGESHGGHILSMLAPIRCARWGGTGLETRPPGAADRVAPCQGERGTTGGPHRRQALLSGIATNLVPLPVFTRMSTSCLPCACASVSAVRTSVTFATALPPTSRMTSPVWRP